MKRASIVVALLACCLFPEGPAVQSAITDISTWEMEPESAISPEGEYIMLTGMAGDGVNSLLVGHRVTGDGDELLPVTLLTSPAGALISRKTLSTAWSGISPRAAYDGTNYLVVWTGLISEEDSYLFGQFIDSEGEPVGSGMLIKSGAGTREIGGIAFNGESYLVIWTDRRNGNADIYAQRISPSGELLGGEIAVCTAPFNQKDPAVSAIDGSFLVAWNDGSRLGLGIGEDVIGQLVTGGGELNGTAFVISRNDYPSDNPLSIAAAGNRYFVVWMEETGGHGTGEWDISGRMITTAGAVAGDEITIAGNTGGQLFPSVAFDGESYLVIWTDMANDMNRNGHFDVGEGTGGDIHGVFLDASGQTDGQPFVISAAAYDQFGAGVSFNAGGFKVAWTDTRSDPLAIYDGMPYGVIYYVTFSRSGPTEVVSAPLPSALSLLANYPNPFNPRTTISFHVPVSGQARMTVWNSVGQEVAILLDGWLEHGTHTVVWEGGSVANGVYFCRLEASDEIVTMKMTLIK